MKRSLLLILMLMCVLYLVLGLFLSGGDSIVTEDSENSESSYSDTGSSVVDPVVMSD